MCDVNIITGEVYHFSRDLHLPGPIPFLLERSYNSFALKDGPLGLGWQSSLDVSADCTSEGTSLVWEDGTLMNLPPIAIGQQIRDQSTGLALRREAAVLTVTTADLSEMHLDATSAERYLLTRRTDQFGNQIAIDRDRSNLVRYVTDSCGRGVQFVYDIEGHLEQLWLRVPNQTLLVRFEYSLSGDLAAVINRTRKPFQYLYDRHLLVAYTNRIGGSVFYEYDSEKKCVQTWRSDGWSRTMRRDPQRQKVLLVDSKGNQTVIEHNKNGHTLSARDAAGLVSENAYDPNGQLIYSSVTPGSPPESQIFDAGNRKLISIVGAEQTEVQYDEAGFPTKQIDPAGRVSEYVYEKGLLRRFESPSGALWKFDYDERGELRAFSMPNGRVIQRTVSNDWRTETLADNYGVMEIVTYDDLGRMILFEDSGGFKTRIWYGKRDELTIATLPDGGVVRYEYDAEGNLIRDTNELGQITEYTFTPFGHLASTVRSGVWRLGREYDTEDNMVAVTTPAGAVARMEYNSRSLMTALRSFDGRETSFRYDNRNQLASCTELPSGNKIEYSYGGQSEVLRAVYSDGGFIDTQYAANGNIIGLANESCQLKFEWDPDGNLIRESRGNDWVEYEYDSLGNVSSVSSSWGIYLNYGWDLRGRLIAASLGSAQTYQFGYDGRDLVTSCLWPNGFDERMVYDSTARLIGSRLYDRSGSEIHRVDYTYDAADRLVRVSRHDGVIVEYFYDPLDRVTHVHRNGALAESYDYDLDGNLLRLRDGTPLEAQRGGRIRFAGSNREVEYNDSGGLARQTVDGKTFAYGYNAMGQLTTVTDHLGNRTEFAYDALGRRLRKISRGGSTDYLWTSLAPLAERSSTGPVNFLFLPGSFFLKAADNGAPFSFVLDHLGSPICAFSGLEEPPIETERSLWSELMPASQPASLPRMGRLGQYWDDEIGLYYNWHRYYDPALARYLQPDPLDLSGGLNLYAYPEQPLAWVDPFGLYTCRIKMNECWNEAQEADAAKKLDSLNEKKKENKNRRKPGRNCYQTAAERWKYCKGKGRLTKDQLKDKRQFRLPCKVQHIDHILEKQLKGGDDCDNLQALNAKVNMSFGAQILRCRRAAGWRTPSSFQFYKTKTIPCKPGEEC